MGGELKLGWKRQFTPLSPKPEPVPGAEHPTAASPQKHHELCRKGPEFKVWETRKVLTHVAIINPATQSQRGRSTCPGADLAAKGLKYAVIPTGLIYVEQNPLVKVQK